MGAVRPGGGDFYMMPNLVDSIIIALGSTGLAMMISILAAYALSRLPMRGQQHFMGWILSTRMMPPVAVAIPMFFIYKNIGLMDSFRDYHHSRFDEFTFSRSINEKFF